MRRFVVLAGMALVGLAANWPQVFIVGVPDAVFEEHRAKAARVADMLNGDSGWARYEHMPSGNFYWLYKCYQKPSAEKLLAMKDILADAGVKWDRGEWAALLAKYSLRRVEPLVEE